MKIKFSEREIMELLKAWFLLSLSFTILFNNSIENIFSFRFFLIFLMSLFSVGISFLFHEFAHKFVAAFYKLNSEFRANNIMLFFGFLTSFFGFIFISPGGVLIDGKINKKKHGIISLAGPFINLMLGLIYMIFIFFKNNYFFTIFIYDILNNFFILNFRINSFLAFFNLIPFFGFDGYNVFKWNKFVFFISFIISISLYFVGLLI